MSSRIRIVLLFLTLLLLTRESLQAQVGDSLTRLAQAASALSDVRLQTPEQQSRLASHAGRMMKDIRTIETATRERKISDAFRKSLDLDTEALGRVRTGAVPDRVLVVAGAVADDLGIKAEYVQQGKGDVDDVAVSAWTRSGSDVRNGYEVWYVPSAHADNQSRYSRFPGISSPTQQPLAPGGYLMWSQQGPALGERKPVDVGKGGQRQTSVDLPIPTAAGRK